MVRHSPRGTFLPLALIRALLFNSIHPLKTSTYEVAKCIRRDEFHFSEWVQSDLKSPFNERKQIYATFD